MKWNDIELKVGDRVAIVGKRGIKWNTEGKMDRYCNRVVTISNIYDNISSFTIKQDADDTERIWFFKVGDVAAIVPKPTITEEPIHKLSSTVCSQDCSIKQTKFTSKIKIGSWEINLIDKTFTEEQIKNMKEMLGWDVENLVGV